MWPYPKLTVYQVNTKTVISDMAILDAVINILDEDVDGYCIHNMALDKTVQELKKTRDTLGKCLKLRYGKWCPMCLEMPIKESEKICWVCAKKYAGKRR